MLFPDGCVISVDTSLWIMLLSRPAVSKFNIAGISDGLGRKRSLPFKDKIIIVDKSVTGIYERRTCFELENGGNTKSC